MDREEFRLRRVAVMDEVSDRLQPVVEQYIDEWQGEDQLYLAIRDEFMRQYRDTFATLTPNAAWREFRNRIKPGIDKITNTSNALRIADWLGTAIVNGARSMGNDRQKMWLSRRDDKVRPFHVEADGQTVPIDEPFTVCGDVRAMFPGEPVGPISCWINCRCVLANPNQFTEVAMTVTIDDVLSYQSDDEPVDDFMDDPIPSMVPWNGVLAPEGIQSGDGRMFSPEALTWRDLPLPLRWQKSDLGGHDGAIIVGTIDDIWRDGELVRGSGNMLDSPESDECVGQILEGALRGISVDVDKAELANGSDEEGVEFGKGRISAATVVHIPAFAEAYIQIGEFTAETEVTSDTTEPIEQIPVPEPSSYADEFKDYTAEQRRRMAEKGQALPDGSFPIADCADLHNAVQAIGRAGDPDKAKRHIKKRAGALNCPDFELPDGWAVDAVTADAEFKRGPGWVTNPKETRKIHAYWTSPGHEGYNKVRFGTPGDFTRLRKYLKKYVDPIYLNRTAALWHRDATGHWPGECGWPGNPPCGAKRAHSDEDVLTASVEPLPYAWFCDPQLEQPTGLVIEGRRIYGHIAQFNVCHTGRKLCTVAPHSQHDYAYFRTGAVVTDQGVVSVGNLTMGGGHPDDGFADAFEAKRHYDDASTVVADVACGDDEYGIWVAGALRDSVTPEQERAILSLAVSGDWRPIGGGLELIAALLVPSPGFPVVRPLVATSGDEQTSLILTSELLPSKTMQSDGFADLAEQIADLAAVKMRQYAANRERVDAARLAVNRERVSAATVSIGGER